jgi:hypothetical protein
MRCLEDKVKTILPSVAAQRATKTKRGKEGISLKKEIRDKTIQVGGPKIGIVFKRNIKMNSYKKMLITMSN